MSTVLTRTPVQGFVTGAAQPKTLTIPSTWASGDLATMVYNGSTAAPTSCASPSGTWLPVMSKVIGSQYYAVWEKTLTSADLNQTVTITGTGAKAVFSILGKYTTGPLLSLLNSYDIADASGTATVHPSGTPTNYATSSVDQILLHKDPSTAVSAVYTPPASVTLQSSVGCGGTSQHSQAVGYIPGDTPAGTVNTGSWSVFASDGTTPISANSTVVITLMTSSVLRPTSDIALPAGANLVGGSSAYATLSDDDATTYVEVTGSGVIERHGFGDIGGVVPEGMYFRYTGANSPTTLSCHAYLDLAGTQLLDLGTTNTLYPTDTPVYYSFSGLSGAQQTSILANPTGLQARFVWTVA